MSQTMKKREKLKGSISFFENPAIENDSPPFDIAHNCFPYLEQAAQSFIALIEKEASHSKP